MTHKAGRHWLIERITSIALIPLCVWFVVQVVTAVGSTHGEAVAFLQSPVNATLLAIVIIIGFIHAAMGVQVVLEDYVPNASKRKTLICIVKLACFALAAVSIAAIVKLNLA